MAGWNGDMDQAVLREFLDQKADLFNTTAFIDQDPILIPHRFSDPADIEISAFLTAILSWGRRQSIISSAGRLVSGMTGGPHAFITGAVDEDFEHFLPFVHRTFNGVDCIYFLRVLRRIYRDYGGLREIFETGYAQHGDMVPAIISFRDIFFREPGPRRTGKHLPDLTRNSAGKRINMFLRWMVRRDERGVDFGIWDGIPMSALYIPLDVHTGTVARKLGMLQRKQDDWKAVEELTSRLREFDPEDPVRYDFALFGLGSFEGF
jgi:uncharacterized protein (TIGR02757 family)